MEDQELEEFLVEWGKRYTVKVKNILTNKLFTYAPGYNKNAYAKGRKIRLAGQSTKIASGSLVNSIEFDEQFTRLNGVINIYMLDYWYWVNYGVKPKKDIQKKRKRGGGGRSPFVQSLIEWYKTRLGLSGTNALSAAIATRMNIWKFGVVPTNFLTIANKEIEKELEQSFGNDAQQYIDALINRIIIEELE